MLKRIDFAKFKSGMIATAVWVAIPALFGLSVYSIWMDRAATAAIAGAFTLSLVILRQLPIIESFKIFTLEAKFVHRLGEYEELLRHIRSTAEVSSLLLYRQIAGAGRMASMKWSIKREMINDLDGLLANLGISALTRDKAKAPFQHSINLDLFRVFEHAVAFRLETYAKQARDAVAAYGAGKPIDPADLQYIHLIEENQRYVLPFKTTYDVMDDGRLDDMDKITQSLINQTPLPDADKIKLEVVRQEVIEHAQACWKVGNVTAEAEVYIDRYGPRVDTRALELFSDSGTEA